jgi:DNA-binding FadR family transcriptional regulator
VLLRDIAGGRYPEGDWLPREVDLATRFDTSRGTAREAIRALEERHVVAVRHGRGARVRPIRDWDLLDPEVLGALVTAGKVEDVIAEALDCRRLLEGEAAARAARQAGRDGIRELTEAFGRLRAAAEAKPVDPGDVADATAAFRHVLVRCSGNRPLARMLEPLEPVNAASLRGLTRRGASELVSRYERILSAVCDSDPDAARAAVEADIDATAAALTRRRR